MPGFQTVQVMPSKFTTSSKTFPSLSPVEHGRPSAPSSSRRRRSFFLATAFSLLISLVLPAGVEAGVVTGYSEFYIPGGEEQLFAIFQDLPTNSKPNPANGMHAVISVTATTDDTTLYYDHWEDGYDLDPNDPASTADETYTLSQGDVQRFESSSIPVNPRGTDVYYDGRDRLLVSGGAVTVTRASWPQSTGTIFALSWEIYPTKPFLTNYTIPVGEDLAAAPTNYDDFDRAYVIVQSTTDGNNVQIDDPRTAGVDVSTTLNQGGVTQLHHIGAGTTVAADQPVQVQFMVGDRKSTFEVRGYTAVPDSLWDTEYYSPVSGFAQGNSDLYLYNPNAFTISLTYEDSQGSGSFTIPARSTRAYSSGAGRFVPQASGVYVRSDSVFWGIGSGDTESQSYDWGFSLVPVWSLTDEYYLGWAPGTSAAIPTSNGSPLFITPVEDDTAVFVDFSPADGVVDRTYILNRLDSQRAFDPDNDNTGMHIWATGPIAVAWGEDPDTALPGNPYLDMGYTTLPLRADWIEAVLAIDKTADPSSLSAEAGQVSTFTLVVSTFDFPVNDVIVTDILPPGWDYVPGSTTVTLPDGSVIDGAAADPTVSGQTLTWVLNQNMGLSQTLTVVFDAVTTAAVSDGFNRNDSQARGTRLGGAQVFTPIDSAWIHLSALTIDKDTSTPQVEPGGIATYTITLVNHGSQTITDVTFQDDLPSGFSYADGSVTETDATRTSSTDPSPGDTSLTWGTWDVDPDGSVTITFDAQVEVGIPLGTYDNTASADSTQTGPIDDDGTVGQDPDTPADQDPEDDEDVTIADSPSSIAVTKTAEPTSVVEPGGPVTYTVQIDNTSAIDAVTIESLSDSVYGDLDGQGDCSLPQTIPAGGAYTCSFTADVIGNAGESETDVVTASGTDDDGIPVSGSDDAVVTITGTSKALTDTDQDHTETPDVAIGEVLTYSVSLVIPPGTREGLTLTDVLDRGLAFRTCLSIIPSSPSLTTTRGDFDTICTTPSVAEEPPGSGDPADQGRRVTFDFGDVTNPDPSGESLTVRYEAVVLNNGENERGVPLNNRAQWGWTDGSLEALGPPVTIVEPSLTLSKSASPTVATPGTAITFTLTVAHAEGSDSDAFDVTLTDTVPSGLSYIPGSLTFISGQTPTSIDASAAPTLRVSWDVFRDNGVNAVLQFGARLGNVGSGRRLTNTALLEWTSLPGDVSDPLSAYNDLATERSYDPPDPVNVYGTSASVTIRVPALPATGFAPGRVTPLPDPPATSPYQALDLWLTIPSLRVWAPVMGVPFEEGEWELAWLGYAAGYLEGTAFPSWPGNTALTAHVTLPDGTPGPFARLGELRWGDTVVLHVGGFRYVYEVRQVLHVRPDDLSALRHEELDWLTLITCEGYDEAQGEYMRRLAVRAVLIEVTGP